MKKSRQLFDYLRATFAIGVIAFLSLVSPVDAITGSSLPSVTVAPTGVYGLKRLVADYTGPALRVRRESDGATQDIGFRGDDLDAASAVAFGGLSSLGVMTLYDQTGHGNNLIQDVPGDQPALYLGKGVPVLVFPGYLKIPTTLTADRANVSMLAVTREVSSNVSGSIFSMGATKGPIDLGLHGFVSCFASQPSYDGKFGAVVPSDGSTVATATPAIVGIVSNQNGISVYRDGVVGSSVPVSSKVMDAGGEIGGLAADSSRQDVLAWLFYPAALSDTEVRSIETRLQAIFGTNPWQPSFNIVLQGDSKTFGVDTPHNLTLARLVSALLPGAVVRNLGISGKTIKEDQTKFDSPRFLQPGALNVLSLYEGINDLSGVLLHGGDTAENIWSYYRTFVSTARSHGWNRIVCCTITPRFIGDFTPRMEVQRLLLNQWIRENKDHLFDAVADFDATTALGSAEHPNRVYLPDGIHETEAAYELEAPVLAEAIKAAAANSASH